MKLSISLVVVVILLTTTCSAMELNCTLASNCWIEGKEATQTLMLSWDTGTELWVKNTFDSERRAYTVNQYTGSVSTPNFKLGFGPSVDIKDGLSAVGLTGAVNAQIGKATYKANFCLMDQDQTTFFSTGNSRIVWKLGERSEAGLGFSLRSQEGRKPDVMAGLNYEIYNSGRDSVRVRWLVGIDGPRAGENELTVGFFFRP